MFIDLDQRIDRYYERALMRYFPLLLRENVLYRIFPNRAYREDINSFSRLLKIEEFISERMLESI